MIRRSDLKIRWIIIFAVVAASIYSIWPVKEKINLGLDLRGGTYILLRADVSGLPSAKHSEAISGAIEKIRSRIDAYGVKETTVQKQGDNSILVQLPGVVERKIINKLKGIGKLEFKLVDEDQAKFEAALKGTVAEDNEFLEYNDSWLLLEKENSIDGADLAESQVGFDQYGVAAVDLKFTSQGAKKFADVTDNNRGSFLAILLDGKIMSAPRIKEAIISGKAQISGDFSMEEARLLSSVLNSGALPIPLSLEEERTVGPLLGSDSIKRGVKSLIFGVGLVFIFIAVYYTVGGIVACICLLLNILLTLGGLSLFHATLTLPGIAGLILSLGMAVDANVLIYERLRDELATKKPLAQALKNSFDRTFVTILDANVTTIIAAVFLFAFGTGSIRGFAITLIIGLTVSMFTAIYISKTIMSFLLERGLHKFPMFQIFPTFKINFLKPRFICIILSLIVLGYGMFNYNSRKENMYGIDFRGGYVLEYKIGTEDKIEDVRKALGDNGIVSVDIQDFKDFEGGVIIKSKEDLTDTIEETLEKNFPDLERLRVTRVGPAVGNILKRKALMAIIFSLFGILAYIGIRFKHWDFALAGVFALLHDVIITLGFLAIFGYEIDLLIVTAVLTIAGYSVNDTIVIYDRIREISPRLHKLSLPEIINTALNNTLSRTIITTLTTLFVTVSMFTLGGASLKSFSFALIVGFMSGIYSTIFIASAFVLVLRRTRV